MLDTPPPNIYNIHMKDSQIAYTHRPLAGVSVGALNPDGETLLVAFSLVNDGSSSNGVFWAENRDTFSRKVAHQIIGNRLCELSGLNDNECAPMGLRLKTNMGGRQFIELFRRVFKPTEDETDTYLCHIVPSLGGQSEIRYRMAAKAIVEKLTDLAYQTVNNNQS